MNLKQDHLKFSNQSRKKKKKKKKKNEKEGEKSLYELWDTFKGNYLLIIVVLEEEGDRQNVF